MGLSSELKQFAKLGGRLNFAVEEPDGRDGPATVEREKVQWKSLYRTNGEGMSPEDFQVAEDHYRPQPLTLQVLFTPETPGVYDAQWVAPPGTYLAGGDIVVRAYSVSDGSPASQRMYFAGTVVECLAERNQKLVPGDAVAKVSIPSLALDQSQFVGEFSRVQMNLAQAVNAVIKGYMGSVGEGGQVTDGVIPVRSRLFPERGYEDLCGQIVDSLAKVDLADGDTVVVSEKVVAISQGRIFPLEILYGKDPKTNDLPERMELLEEVRKHVADVTAEDLICADSLLDWPDGPMATAGVADPNQAAYDIAKQIAERLGKSCDVVISDTDTGLDIRETLINTVTIGATPLGSTGGLVIYECMRVANAAEFCRGSHRMIPIVVCRSHARRVQRIGMGEHRGYPGRLDARRERLLGFA